MNAGYRPSGTLRRMAPVVDIRRRLSAPEYYHASTGRYARTAYPPREIVFIVEGVADGMPISWQSALDRVAATNPGTRLRLHSQRLHAHWRSDGPGPRLRIVEQCDWDGRSEIGAEFIDSTVLSLEDGPVAELIVAGRGAGTKIIFRVLHAVMDGMGAMHFFRELFRALRGDSVLGSNAAFSDVDLMRHVAARERSALRFPRPARTAGRPLCLTGDLRHARTGHVWRRISLCGTQSNLLGRVAVAVGAFARKHDPASVAPVRIAVPVDLRRHVPGLLSTANLSSMVHVDVAAGDGPEDFRQRLRTLLDVGADTDYSRVIELIRVMPFAWLDRMLTDTSDNYIRPRFIETAVLSNPGRFARDALSCPGFAARCIYGIPIESNCFIMMFSLDKQVEITVGMTRVLAGDGQLDEFVGFLAQRLG